MDCKKDLLDQIHELLTTYFEDEVADEFGLDTVTDEDGNRMVAEDGWYADDGNAEVHYPFADSGEEAAQDYVADGDWVDGDWGDASGTTWVLVYTWRRGVRLTEDGQLVWSTTEREAHKIAIEPDEPGCDDGENHEWEETGVQGHGGGVVIHETCTKCALERTTNTWAQDPTDGEDGLTSIRYV